MGPKGRGKLLKIWMWNLWKEGMTAGQRMLGRGFFFFFQDEKKKKEKTGEDIGKWHIC